LDGTATPSAKSDPTVRGPFVASQLRPGDGWGPTGKLSAEEGAVEADMYVVVVHIQMKAEHREAFLESMLDNAQRSFEDEPGCYRFDVIQDETDPNTLILYEIYHDRAAFDDHLSRPHFIRWRDTVREWHAVPARSWKGPNLYPPDETIR
jgi:(4S)-4-hydroxy-5-phosphonooxypentane-2,3-dione isomerase